MPNIVVIFLCIGFMFVGFCLGNMFQLWLQLKELRKELLDKQLRLFELYQLKEMIRK